MVFLFALFHDGYHAFSASDKPNRYQSLFWQTNNPDAIRIVDMDQSPAEISVDDTTPQTIVVATPDMNKLGDYVKEGIDVRYLPAPTERAATAVGTDIIRRKLKGEHEKVVKKEIHNMHLRLLATGPIIRRRLDSVESESAHTQITNAFKENSNVDTMSALTNPDLKNTAQGQKPHSYFLMITKRSYRESKSEEEEEKEVENSPEEKLEEDSSEENSEEDADEGTPQEEEEEEENLPEQKDEENSSGGMAVEVAGMDLDIVDEETSITDQYVLHVEPRALRRLKEEPNARDEESASQQQAARPPKKRHKIDAQATPPRFRGIVTRITRTRKLFLALTGTSLSSCRSRARQTHWKELINSTRIRCLRNC